MSDIRTKLLLGTSISAVAMMFVMVSGFDLSSNETVVSLSGFPINGHVTMLVVNPDGSTSYAQSDNVIQGAGKDLAASALYDPNGGSRADAFVCIGLGESGAVDDSTQALTDAFDFTNVVCSGDVPTAVQAGLNGATPNQVNVTAVFINLDGTTTVTEVALSNAGGGGLPSTAAFNAGVLSHVDIADVDVVAGTEVTVTFTMDTG